MVDFKLHEIENAPEAAREPLKQAKEQLGMVPNLFKILANSPPALKAYLTLNGLLSETGFDAVEQQALLLSISYENGCDYCMGAHSVLADKAGLDKDSLKAIRQGDPLPDEKLEALHRFAARVVETRGHPEEADIEAFLSAGYEKERILDVLLAVAMKTLSNYTNHIAGTPLDDAFRAMAWEPNEG